jgi:type II secretory pathway component PulJ
MSRPPAEPDDGFSMIDMVVSMMIMGVVTAICTAGIVQLYWANTGAEASSTAQSQIAVAVQRMDKQVRYASRIHWTSSTAITYEVVEGGVDRCYDTKLNGQLLQQRAKVVGGSYGSWATLTSQVTAGGFSYLAPTDVNDHQRLRVQLTASSASGSTVTKQVDVTFTALNTSRASDTDSC